MKKKTRLWVMMALVLIATVYFAPTSHAAFLGGKWTYDIGWYANSTDPYYSYFQNAASNWNAVTVERDWYQTTAVAASVLAQSDFYGAIGWAGLGTPGPDIYSGYYTYGSVKINRTYADTPSYSPTNKKLALATHEFGHVMGLAHTANTSYMSIMYSDMYQVYDVWGIYTPTVFDTSNINYLYP